MIVVQKAINIEQHRQHLKLPSPCIIWNQIYKSQNLDQLQICKWTTLDTWLLHQRRRCIKEAQQVVTETPPMADIQHAKYVELQEMRDQGFRWGHNEDTCKDIQHSVKWQRGSSNMATMQCSFLPGVHFSINTSCFKSFPLPFAEKI